MPLPHVVALLWNVETGFLSGRNWVIRSHGHGAIARGNALDREPQPLGDPKTLHSLNRVTRAGWVVATANKAGGKRLEIALIEPHGSEIESCGYLLLRSTQGIERYEEDQQRGNTEHRVRSFHSEVSIEPHQSTFVPYALVNTR